MGVMAIFQLQFLQNACFRVKMAPGQGHLCSIDTFLVLTIVQLGQDSQVTENIRNFHDKCLTKWYMQTVQLLKEQSDQGLHCLPFY